MKKEAAKYLAMILGNISAIGFGLTLYEQKWWTFCIALICAKIGFWIMWRLDDDVN